MARILRTASGAEYEFEGTRVRRLSGESEEKRADGDWIELVNYEEFTGADSLVGRCAVLVLESLAVYGPDDYGVEDSPAPMTTRITTPVVEDTGYGL